MKRQKDSTLHTCKLCKEQIPASGMGSHLYHKHEKLTSNEYVKLHGEFRQKYLKEKEKQSQEFSCKECSFIASSHKHLMHHVQKVHNSWEQYIIKHFYKGIFPTCKCGCGEAVKLIRHGKNEQGKTTYARDYTQGHGTRKRTLGYRENTVEQRQRMRDSAIKRMKESNSTFHQAGPSRSEQELKDYIDSLGIQTISSDRTLLKGLEIDILLPDLKIAIEYNGSYFHSDLFKNRQYHLKKTEEVEALGYRMVHVWEPDWYSSSDILKSMIKHICGKTGRILYGRSTKVCKISREECNNFLNRNHLQGSAIGKVYLGLYYGKELVQVMSFSKLRTATGLKHKEGSYELLRTATTLHTQVVGGTSKLLKHFIKVYNPEYILSYANRDWSKGNVYTTVGFKYVGTTPPGYYYVKSRKKYSRFQFQKHKLIQQGADPQLTEYEIMKQKGFVRVWDCGNLKYEWKKQ